MMKLVVLFYTFLRLSWGLEGGRQDKAMEVRITYSNILLHNITTGVSSHLLLTHVNVST